MNTRVAQALLQARAQGLDRLDAQLLLCEVLSRPRSWLLANDDAELSGEQSARLAALISRRASCEPLAYLLGSQEFHGLSLTVSPAVLIPRADTETLVDWALESLHSSGKTQVLDVGTGSGAIALAIKHAHPAARVSALDASSEALAVAQNNATRLGLDVRFVLSDWWQAIDDERFQLIVSNPPYIADGDMHLAALKHEPQLALTSGADGLDALRCIIDGAPDHLEPGGWLLLEHGYNQAEIVASLLQQRGFQFIATRRDLGGHTRCTGGRHV